MSNYGPWVDSNNTVSETESPTTTTTSLSGRAYQDTAASKRKRRELPPPPTLDDLDMKNKVPKEQTGGAKQPGSQYANVKPKVSSRRQIEKLIAEQEAEGDLDDDELLYDSDDEELLDLHRLISGRRGMTLEHAMERENQLMLSQERLEAIREHYEQIGDVSERLISIVGEVVPNNEEEQFDTFDVHRQDFMENVGRTVASDLFEHIKLEDLREELWNLHEWMDGTLDRETEDDFDLIEKDQEDRESLINNAKYIVDGIVAEMNNEKNQVFDVWSQLTSAQHQLTEKQQAALDAYQKKLKNARDETVKSRRRHPRDSSDSERSVVKKLQDRENQIEVLKEEIGELERQMAEKQRKHTEEVRFLKAQMIDESIRSMKDEGEDAFNLTPLQRLQRENKQDKEQLKALNTKLQKAQEQIFALSSLLQAIPSEGGDESQSRALLTHMVDMQKERDEFAEKQRQTVEDEFNRKLEKVESRLAQQWEERVEQAIALEDSLQQSNQFLEEQLETTRHDLEQATEELHKIKRSQKSKQKWGSTLRRLNESKKKKEEEDKKSSSPAVRRMKKAARSQSAMNLMAMRSPNLAMGLLAEIEREERLESEASEGERSNKSRGSELTVSSIDSDLSAMSNQDLVQHMSTTFEEAQNQLALVFEEYANTAAHVAERDQEWQETIRLVDSIDDYQGQASQRHDQERESIQVLKDKLMSSMAEGEDANEGEKAMKRFSSSRSLRGVAEPEEDIEALLDSEIEAVEEEFQTLMEMVDSSGPDLRHSKSQFGFLHDKIVQSNAQMKSMRMQYEDNQRNTQQQLDQLILKHRIIEAQMIVTTEDNRIELAKDQMRLVGEISIIKENKEQQLKELYDKGRGFHGRLMMMRNDQEVVNSKLKEIADMLISKLRLYIEQRNQHVSHLEKLQGEQAKKREEIEKKNEELVEAKSVETQERMEARQKHLKGIWANTSRSIMTNMRKVEHEKMKEMQRQVSELEQKLEIEEKRKMDEIQAMRDDIQRQLDAQEDEMRTIWQRKQTEIQEEYEKKMNMVERQKKAVMQQQSVLRTSTKSRRSAEQTRYNEMESKLRDLEKSLENVVGEKEEHETSLLQQLEQTKQAAEKERMSLEKGLQAELAKIQLRKAQEVDALKEEHMIQLEREQEKFNDELKRQEEEHNKRMEDAESMMARELETFQEELAQRMEGELKEGYAEMQREYKQDKEKLKREMAEMEKKAQEELEQKRKELEEELERKQAESEEQMRQREREYQKQMELRERDLDNKAQNLAREKREMLEAQQAQQSQFEHERIQSQHSDPSMVPAVGQPGAMDSSYQPGTGGGTDRGTYSFERYNLPSVNTKSYSTVGNLQTINERRSMVDYMDSPGPGASKRKSPRPAQRDRMNSSGSMGRPGSQSGAQESNESGRAAGRMSSGRLHTGSPSTRVPDRSVSNVNYRVEDDEAFKEGAFVIKAPPRSPRNPGVSTIGGSGSQSTSGSATAAKRRSDGLASARELDSRIQEQKRRLAELQAQAAANGYPIQEEPQILVIERPDEQSMGESSSGGLIAGDEEEAIGGINGSATGTSTTTVGGGKEARRVKIVPRQTVKNVMGSNKSWSKEAQQNKQKARNLTQQIVAHDMEMNTLDEINKKVAEEYRDLYKELQEKEAELQHKKREKVAAVKIQSTYRGHVKRLLFNKKTELRRLEKDIEKMQSKNDFSMEKLKSELKDAEKRVERMKRDHQAAIEIQRTYRGHRTRELVDKLKELEQLEEMERKQIEAAADASRQQYQELQGRLQSVEQESQVRREHNQAATKIQKVYRGKRDRTVTKQLREALEEEAVASGKPKAEFTTVKMGSRLGMMSMEDLRNAAQRKEKNRMKRKLEKEAATRIQSTFRGSKVRKAHRVRYGPAKRDIHSHGMMLEGHRAVSSGGSDQNAAGGAFKRHQPAYAGVTSDRGINPVTQPPKPEMEAHERDITEIRAEIEKQMTEARKAALEEKLEQSAQEAAFMMNAEPNAQGSRAGSILSSEHVPKQRSDLKMSANVLGSATVPSMEMNALPAHRPIHQAPENASAGHRNREQKAKQDYESGLAKANQETATESELRSQEKGGQSFEARANKILQLDMATQAKRSQDEELDERIERMTKGPKPRFPVSSRKHVIAPPEVRKSGGNPNKKEVPAAVQNALRLQRIEEAKSDLMRLQSALSTTFVRYKRLVGDLLEHNPDGKTLTVNQRKVHELQVVDVEEIANEPMQAGIAAQIGTVPGTSRPTSVKRVRAGRRRSEVSQSISVRRGSDSRRSSVSSQVEQSVSTTTTTTTTTTTMTRVASPNVSLSDLGRFSPGGSRLGTPPRTPNRISPTKAFSGDPQQFAVKSMEEEILMLRVLLERERQDHEKTKEHLRKEANERRLAKLTMETTKLVGNVLLDMHRPIQDKVNQSTLPQITGAKPYHTVGVRPMGGTRLSIAPMPPPQIIDDDVEERYLINTVGSDNPISATATTTSSTTTTTNTTSTPSGVASSGTAATATPPTDVMSGSVLGRGNKTYVASKAVAPKAFAPVIPADMPEVRNAKLVEQQQAQEQAAAETKNDKRPSMSTRGRKKKKKELTPSDKKKPQPPSSSKSKKPKQKPQQQSLGTTSVRFDLPGDSISPWGDGQPGNATSSGTLGKKKRAKGAFAKQEHVRAKMFG